MLKIRPAKKGDRRAAINILKEHDIYYSALAFKDFWVAQEDGEIVGCAQLEEFPGFFYLGSVGTLSSRTGKGIARALLGAVLKGLKKDTYLYTTIPGFFKKFGFEITTPMAGLPSKECYECEDCHSDRCVCMVRRANDTPLP